jgi:tRNA A37 methylthiotransferase MiaB
LGQDLIVLVERPLFGDIYIGLSDNYVEVEFAGPQNLVGQFVNVKVVNVEQERVIGVINS